MLFAQSIQENLPMQAQPNIFVSLMPLVFIGAILYFWIKMLIDCLNSDLEGSKRISWTVVILLTNILGAVLYYFVIKKGNKTQISSNKN